MSFAGLRVLSLESRRSGEMAELIRKHGGEPVVAPSMREVPLDVYKRQGTGSTISTPVQLQISNRSFFR